MYANRKPKVETRTRTSVQIDFSECEIMTEQHHKEECDILNIVRKYEKLGIDPSMMMFTESDCMDITDAPSYLEAQNQIAEANSLFEGMPARIRAQFQNSPHYFLEFMQDSKNIDEIEKIGLNADHLKKATESPVSDLKKEAVPNTKKTNKNEQTKVQEGE
ncbi:internal scaffolding protein [Microviridae sp.]|nr:internal scaffolding protein [Microviridae sp.]